MTAGQIVQVVVVVVVVVVQLLWLVHHHQRVAPFQHPPLQQRWERRLRSRRQQHHAPPPAPPPSLHPTHRARGCWPRTNLRWCPSWPAMLPRAASPVVCTTHHTLRGGAQHTKKPLRLLLTRHSSARESRPPSGAQARHAGRVNGNANGGNANNNNNNNNNSNNNNKSSTRWRQGLHLMPHPRHSMQCPGRLSAPLFPHRRPCQPCSHPLRMNQT